MIVRGTTTVNAVQAVSYPSQETLSSCGLSSGVSEQQVHRTVSCCGHALDLLLGNAMRFINVLFLFRIRRNLLRSGSGRSMQLLIIKVIKQTVVIVEA